LGNVVEVDLVELVSLNAVIDSILGVVIALGIVSWVVRRQNEKWLDSEKGKRYMDKLADHVIAKLPPLPTTEKFMEAIEPRISGLEERINEPIQLDLAPIVKEVTGNVIAEVDRIRAVIDGKMGWLAKVDKKTGEAIAEQVGGAVLEQSGMSPGQQRIYKRFKALLADAKWQKENPAAAAGIDALVAEMEESSGSVSSGSRSTGRRGIGLMRER